MPKSTKFETVSVKELQERLTVDQSEPNPVVLVVDDERIIADTLVAILDQSGFAAMAAYDAETALQIAQTIPPNVLVTDIVMPGMDGIHLATKVQEQVPDCRVLLFSGQVGTVAFSNGHHFPLLAKPVHPAQLVNEVAGLTNGKP